MNHSFRTVYRSFLMAGLATLALPVQAQISDDQLGSLASEVQPQVVEWRRWFHQNPELSNREFNTSKHIEAALREMGLEPQTGIARTGLVAVIEGGKPGPMIALRADMDALPVTEQTGLPFASTAKAEYNGQEVGVMHACGHDNHMAMLLGAAQVLNSVKEDLAGSIMLIFQPAEEGPPGDEEGGASLMLDEGIWDSVKPEAVFGIHVGIGVPGGEIAVKPGPLMAAADSWKLTITGKQTHGARPWDGVDPIAVSAQIIQGLQTIASRTVDVTLAPSIISVGRIQGGIRSNVIPDEVVMEGTIRTFDQAMREDIHERFRKMATGVAEIAGAEAVLELDMAKGTPSVYNDPDLLARVMPSLQKAVGEDGINSLTPQTVAEDFSEFAMRTPGVFLFLGNAAPGQDPAGMPANHSPFFDMHEPNLELGVRIFTQMAVDYLNSPR